MSREQLSEHQAEGAAPAQAEQQGDIQGLPPNVYHQASRIRPGDAQGLRDLLTLFPDFGPQILAVASQHGAGLSTVKQAQAMVQQNAVGRGGALTSQQMHAGGEFALEGSAPVAGPAPQGQAAATAPLSKPEQAQILHDPSDPKPLSKPELGHILHDPSDPKPLNKPELGHILNDPSDPYHVASDDLLVPTQIEDAKGYNAGHADLVKTFNHLTTNLCCEVPGASGPVDPQKVATWQANRNLQVDGKIGPHTIAAARAAVKNHTEIVAEGQANPQPTNMPV